MIGYSKKNWEKYLTRKIYAFQQKKKNTQIKV